MRTKSVPDSKKRIIQNDTTLKDVGIHIKPSESLSPTYTIPDPVFRRSVLVEPPAPKGTYISEPTLNEKVYQDILQTIFDVGKVFERLPSTYSERKEQELRDLFLIFLEPRYKGSATGETFNVKGKTDILIRHDNSNVFIAECKFWSGPKGYLDAITQLLSYITWRDTKTAIILFAQTKELSHVLTSIKDATQHHSNYLKFISSNHDTWLDYRFFMNGDRNREVMLNVLIFHFPPHIYINGNDIGTAPFHG